MYCYIVYCADTGERKFFKFFPEAFYYEKQKGPGWYMQTIPQNKGFTNLEDIPLQAHLES